MLINKSIYKLILNYKEKGVLFLITIPLVFFAFIMLNAVKNTEQEHISEVISGEANQQIEELNSIFKEGENLALILSKLDIESNKKNRVIQKLIKDNDYIDHIRYINLDGQEIVRFQKEDKFYPLKNVARRNYHQSAVTLNEDEVYISEIELNREGHAHQIEKPYKPVIRIAAPIYENNLIKKYIIINILPNKIFETFQDSLLKEKYEAKLIVIDRRGYFLEHPNSSLEFGFDLGNMNNKAELLLDKSLWNYIVKQNSKQENEKLISHIKFDNNKYLAYVKKADFQDLSFVILIPESIAHKELYQFIFLFLLGCLIALITIVFLSLKIYSLSSQIKTTELEKELIYKYQIEQGKFFASMSHEIRTPLTGILGTVDVIVNEIKDEKVITYVHIIKSSGLHLLQLINEILDLSKLKAKKIKILYEQFNLYQLTQEIKESFSATVEKKNLEFECIYESNLGQYFLGDTFRLKQILNNLISNAIKFTDKGSITLIISKEQNLTKEKIKHLDINIDHPFINPVLIKFVVKDTGIGIPLEQQKSIFDPFIQASEMVEKDYGGTGLGLSITQQLVELMGGNIQLKSEMGKGSEFSFTVILDQVQDINIKENKQVFSEPKTSQNQDLSTVKRKILLAEDNQVNQKIISIIIKSLGYDCDIASNGNEVLSLIANKNYDIILMDYHMPILDGIEATKEIRKQNNNITIIALTASAFSEEIQNCLNAGMNDYVFKPIDKEMLDKKIKEYLEL